VLPLRRRTARSAFAPGHRRDTHSLSGAGARVLADSVPATFFPLSRSGIFHRAYRLSGTLTLQPDVALKTWTALGKASRAAGIKKLVMVTSHGGQQRGNGPGGAGTAGAFGLLAVTTAWSRFGVPDGLFPADESAIMAVHGRRGRNVDHAGAGTGSRCGRCDSPTFVPQRLRWKRIFAGSPGSDRRLSRGRRRTFTPSGVVGDATKASAEKGELLLDHGARRSGELLVDVDNFDVIDLQTAPALSFPDA